MGLLTAIGVLLALIAAGTGVVSVRQGRRAWRASQRPMLEVGIVHRDGETLEATFVNSGQAAALGTSFLLVAGGSRVSGGLGVMEAGRRTVIQTREPVTGSDSLALLVSCRETDDVVQNVFLTKHARERKWWRKRPWNKQPDDEQFFRDHFGANTLNNLKAVGYTYPMLTQP